jgi:hypothetical protein
MMISAGEAALLRRDIERTWAETATVYVRGAGGQYTTVVRTGLLYSLTSIGGTATTMAERAELAAARVLKWTADYTMPDNAQVEIAGRRWNVRRETVDLRKARPGPHPLYWMADVVRVP